MITIIDTAFGNLASIKNMLRRAGADAIISADADVIRKAERLILPGIGAFDAGMARLKDLGVVELIKARAFEERVPLLGICLGAQMLFESSEEGVAPGLGLIQGRVVRFDSAKMASELRIPHMGWSDVTVRKASRLFETMHENPRFYFVHSFHFAPAEPADELCTAEHGYPFAAAVERGNVFGVQFHPEKSHKFGLKLLESFSKVSS